MTFDLSEEIQTEIETKLANRICEAVREHVVHAPEFTGSIQISIGVAVSNSSTKTEDDLLQAADIALYSAKGKGGDQAVVAGPWPMEEAELGDGAQLKTISELESTLAS